MENEIIEYILNNKEKHYRIAYSYVKNKEDALDIVQDAIVKALKYQSSLKEIGYVNTWFCRIIINTAKTYLQKQNKYIDVDDGALESCQMPVYDHYTNFELEDALEYLSYTEKTIVILKYIEGLELKEIATVMEKNISTIKSILYRALKKLRILLENEHKG
ncbi:MAG: RNA polymerase sigma factor [Cellulosilyticaceae bacterium]